jgi:hypothetical protein
MMSNAESKMCALAVAVGLAFVGRASVGAVDVRVQFDKAFDFKVARTWDWNASGPGEVKMARTPDDDPEAMRRRAEPVIMDAVASELGKRGIQRATGMPDVQLTYYLLLTTSASAQTLGPSAVRAIDAVAGSDEPGIAGARCERQSERGLAGRRRGANQNRH